MEFAAGSAEAAQQYFHSYKIPTGSEEIVLREYDLSVQSLSGDQRSIALATGLTVVSLGFLGSLIGSDKGIQIISEFLGRADPFSEWACYIGIFSVALIALRFRVMPGETEKAYAEFVVPCSEWVVQVFVDVAQPKHVTQNSKKPLSYERKALVPLSEACKSSGQK